MTQAEIEARMLSGEPFTYSGLCAWRADKEQGAYKTQFGDHDRLIDRTIQKLRRAGKIAYKREGNLTVWRPVEAA